MMSMGKQPAGYPYITVTQGMSGHFAVMIWHNPDMGGFEEPWSTAPGRHRKFDDAMREARAWSELEGVALVLTKKRPDIKPKSLEEIATMIGAKVIKL